MLLQPDIFNSSSSAQPDLREMKRINVIHQSNEKDEVFPNLAIGKTPLSEISRQNSMFRDRREGHDESNALNPTSLK